MKFIRENLFYVALAGGVLICGIVLLLVGSSFKGRLQKQELPRRQDLSKTMNAIQRSPANQQMVEDAKRRVAAIQQSAATVRQQAMEWNARNYTVLEIGEDETSRAAFPIEDWPAGLRPWFRFTENYLESFNSAIQQLGPAQPVTQAVRDAFVAQRQANLLAGGVPGADVRQQAEQEGRDRALLQSASSGLMYVQSADLDMVFRQAHGAMLPSSELWQAQLNLWVTQDILAAIAKTNQQAHAALPQGQTPSVLNSAVKRLVSTQISRTYFIGQQAAAAAGRPSGPGGSAFDDPRPQATAAALVTMTKRVTNQTHSVLHYSFTVVMPSRHLPALMQNLLDRNYHTIRSVRMAAPRETDRDTFHYGIEPVLEITIEGELLLLAGWERPLMPKDVLRSLPEAARRPEDNQRLAAR